MANTPLLLDRYGAALKRTQRYSSATTKLNGTGFINRSIGSGTQNAFKFLNPSERRLINQFALDLFRSSPVISSAIKRKNEWACATAWKPVFRGSDKDWGKKAYNYLVNVAFPNCNVAGANYTFNRTLLTIANQLDIFGDSLIVLTVTRDGLSRIAVYPSNMVGQREQGRQVVESGRYKGALIDDGVIQNSFSTPIAYRVLQDTKEEDSDLSARDAHLIFEPNELCVRGVSVVAPSLISILNLEDIASYLNQTVKNESKQGLIVSTETGNSSDFENPYADQLGDTASTAANFQPSIIDLGDVTFVNAKSGEKVESLKTDRPHTNTVAWIKHISEQVCSDLGWPLGLVNAANLNGTAARMIEAQVQQTVAVRQQTLKRIALIYTNFTLARAMENGELPMNATEDWRFWDFSMPAEFVLDSYYSDQTDLQGWNAGSKTLQDIASRNGGNWEETREQRNVESKNGIENAVALVQHAKSLGEELSFERALSMVGMGGTQHAAPVSETIVTNQNAE